MTPTARVDGLSGLLRDFDGSEILDTEIQEATRKARAADVASLALDMVRDAAAASYTTAPPARSGVPGKAR